MSAEGKDRPGREQVEQAQDGHGGVIGRPHTADEGEPIIAAEEEAARIRPMTTRSARPGAGSTCTHRSSSG